MANENNIVEVGIETKVAGEKKIQTYADSLEKLDKIKLDNLNKAQTNVSNLENRLKGAADSAERLNKALANAGVSRGSTAGVDKQAQAAANAEVAAKKLAATQQKAANIATVSAAQTTAANNKAAAATNNAAAISTNAQTRVQAANARSATSAQNLATAQARADQSQQRTAVSAQNLATAQQRADQSQARAAISAQRIQNAQIRTSIETDNLNKKLSDQSGWNNLQKNVSKANASLGNFGQNLSNAGRSLTATLTTSIAGLAYLSIDSAKNLDTYRNRLTAFEGSVTAAESKIKLLRQLAQDSAGVTTSLALDTYSQLSAVGELTEGTIEKQIKATGKLNSAFSLPDPKEYNRNLLQIFQQDFEKQDLKQAVGVNPIFYQLLDSAFGTSDPAKLKALKNAGKLTLDSFISGLADATENDERLKGLGDSIGVRLTKTFERIQFAFAPLGEAIIKAIEPLIPYIVSFVEYLSTAFSSLSPYAQTLTVIFGAIAAAAGPFLVLIGGIISGGSSVIAFFGTLASGAGAVGGALASLGGFISAFIGLIGEAGLTASLSALVSVLGGTVISAITAAVAALGEILLGVAAVVAVVVAAGAAIGAVVYLLYRVWEQNIGGIQQKAVAVFGAVKDFVVSTFNQIRDKFNEVLPQLEKLTQNILGAIQNFWDLHGQAIVDTVTVLWNIIKVVVTEGINIISEIIKFTLAIVNGDWQAAADANNAIVEKLWKILLEIVGAGVRLFIEALQFLFREIFAIFDRIAEAAIDFGYRFVNGIVDAIKNSPQLITSAIEYLFTNAVSDAYNAVYNAGARLWSYLKDGYTGGQQNAPLLPENAPQVAISGEASAKLPRKSSSIGGKTKKKKEPSAKSYEPIDAADRARVEQKRLDEQFGNQFDIANLERARTLTKFFGEEFAERLKLASVGIASYYKQIRELRAKDIDLEIQALEEKKKHAEDFLAHLPDTKKNARERDKQQAEIINLTGEIQRKNDEKTISSINTNREELDSILELVQANRDLYKTYLDLNDETRKSAQLEIDTEFNKKIEQNRLDLSSARARLAEIEKQTAGGDQSNAPLVERYKLLVETLTKNAEYLESIKSQKELQADFNEQQKQLNLIFDQRQIAMDELNRQLTETGADDDTATKRRREEMDKYKKSIDAVIERLGFIATGLKNPDAKKEVDRLKGQRAGEDSVSFEEQLRTVQRPLEDSLRARDQRLKENELSNASDFEKQANRLAILKETTAELLKQADAYVALAEKSGNPKIIADALAQRDAIRQNANEIQSFGTKLRNVSIDAFASGLNQFFLDLASGTQSATDALFNFVGAFIQAIQEMIVQILAYMAVALILKALGVPIPASIASGAGIGGKADGGAASTLPVVPFAGNFATGGAPNQYAGNVLIGSGGLIRGAGGPRSDSIPTYFPAARRFGNTSNTEFILDAETTRNIGVERLNALLATKGLGAGGALFERLANRRGNFATGGAANESVLSGFGKFDTPEIAGGETNVDMTTLNYFGKAPIEEVIAEHGLSPAGDRLFVNQFDRNIGKLKAKLGIKGS